MQVWEKGQDCYSGLVYWLKKPCNSAHPSISAVKAIVNAFIFHAAHNNGRSSWIQFPILSEYYKWNSQGCYEYAATTVAGPLRLWPLAYSLGNSFWWDHRSSRQIHTTLSALGRSKIETVVMSECQKPYVLASVCADYMGMANLACGTAAKGRSFQQKYFRLLFSFEMNCPLISGHRSSMDQPSKAQTDLYFPRMYLGIQLKVCELGMFYEVLLFKGLRCVPWHFI